METILTDYFVLLIAMLVKERGGRGGGVGAEEDDTRPVAVGQLCWQTSIAGTNRSSLYNVCTIISNKIISNIEMNNSNVFF